MTENTSNAYDLKAITSFIQQVSSWINKSPTKIVRRLKSNKNPIKQSYSGYKANN